ncbi:MAG: spore coat protein [Mesobacillus sp.]|uniref:spore coat protein n=1 Tax=Mesobacillus sp. TaxID=2675271 RepID=UPI003C4C4DF0
MNDHPKKPNAIPNSLIDLFVNDILQKNGISKNEVKENLSDDKKQAIKELVEDLSKQVDSFINASNNSNKNPGSKK